MGKQIDPIFQRAMKFAQNFKKAHDKQTISNIYVIQRKDSEGNVLEEKYGMNLMTHYGMQQFFSNNLPAFPTKLYVGAGGGGGSFDGSTKTLITPLSSNNATVVNSTIYYNLPFYYDRTSGLVTTVCRYLVASLPTNFDNWYYDIDIYEYGIGSDVDNLWTHSWVYDNFGSIGNITKHPNEELVFTVFLCMSYPTNMINTQWALGKHMVITTPQRFFANHMRPTNIKTFKRYSIMQDRTVTASQEAAIDNQYTIHANMNEITIINGDTAEAGYVDGFINISPGFFEIERAYMSPVCQIDTVMKPDTASCENPEGYSDTFGKQGFLPFSQADIQHSYTYNPLTNLYDLPDTYVQSANRWYDETSLEHGCAQKLLYYGQTGTLSTLYVYVNMKTDDPIIKVEGNLLTVYATNEYWDRSKWVYIRDLDNIPSTCDILDGGGNPLNPRCMKYWLTSSNAEDLKPVRASQKFAYIDSSGNFTYSHNFGSLPKLMNDVLSSFDYHWFLINSTVYMLDTNTTLRMTQSSTDYTSIKSYTNGKVIVTLVNGSDSYSYADMTAVTPAAVSVQNSGGIADLKSCYVTDSKTGRLVISDTSGSKLLKINFTDETNVTDVCINNCVLACAIQQTSYYAMIDSANPKKVIIKNFDTDVTVQEFTVTGNNPTLIFGYQNQVYISDCSTYTQVGYIDTGVIEACDTNDRFNGDWCGGNLKYLRIDSVHDYLVIHRWDQRDTNTYAYTFRYRQPTQVKRLGLNPDSYHSYSAISLHELNETNGTRTTVMIIAFGYYPNYGNSGIRMVAVDLSRYKESDQSDTSAALVMPDRSDMQRWIPYGDHIIYGSHTFPIANVIKHRIVGTTDTVSTVDAYKNIRNKFWTTVVTNISPWNGKPPGIQPGDS